jgi:hypothetical protein
VQSGWIDEYAFRRRQADRRPMRHREDVWEAALIEGLLTDGCGA